jgi:hypothetical protein
VKIFCLPCAGIWSKKDKEIKNLTIDEYFIILKITCGQIFSVKNIHSKSRIDYIPVYLTNCDHFSEQYLELSEPADTSMS